jgi:threonine dehydrogenase-like Zn-dependent dehydrogenase
LSSHRFPLEKAITHTFGLKQVDEAIKAVAGKGPADVIHVSVNPWLDAA